MKEIELALISTKEVSELHEHIGKQLDFLGVDLGTWSGHEEVVYSALTQLHGCFSFLKNKYFNRNGKAYFSPLQTSQYTIFLYYLSRALKNIAKNEELASGVYALNKMLHSVDLFYEVELPDVFYLDHPLGSVIGRGSFSNFFQFRQNCTVGNNRGIFPVFGINVQLWSGVTIVGNCKIGDHVIFSSGTYVKDQDIPPFSIVFGRSPNLVIKPLDPETAKKSDFFIF